MESVIIVAHGSDNKDAEDAASKHARRLSEALGTQVLYVFKGDDSPNIGEALEKVAESGADSLAVIPLFFAPGMFANKVVPKKFGLEEGAREGAVDLGGRRIPIRITGVFGAHPGMRDVMGAVVESTRADGPTGYMLIGHGSMDGNNSGCVRTCAGYVRDLGFDAEACFNEMEEPTVEAGLEEMFSHGYARLVVVPMFVSPGYHTDVEIPAKLGLEPGTRRRVSDGGTEIVYLHEVGLEDGVTGILLKLLEGE